MKTPCQRLCAACAIALAVMPWGSWAAASEHALPRLAAAAEPQRLNWRINELESELVVLRAHAVQQAASLDHLREQAALSSAQRARAGLAWALVMLVLPSLALWWRTLCRWGQRGVMRSLWRPALRSGGA